MSFPNKIERQRCWDSKDRYWECLEKNSENKEACTEIRKIYESNCSAQWVKHFDRKRSYLLFKDQVEKEGASMSSAAGCGTSAENCLISPDKKMTMMKHLKEYSLEECHAYLTDLLNAKTVIKLEMNYFETLVFPTTHTAYNLIDKNINIILKLLEETEKYYPLCSDLIYALEVLILAKNGIQADTLLIVSEQEKHMGLLLKNSVKYCEQSTLISILGTITYSLKKGFNVEDADQCDQINRRMEAELEVQLKNLSRIDMTIHATEVWLSFLSKLTNCGIAMKDPCKIFKSVMSVVITFWNHILVDGIKIVQLFSNYVQFEYTRIKADGSEITEMTIFTCMLEMPWNVPFTYFVYLHVLKFSMSVNSISKVLQAVKPKLQEGFIQSLKKKNAIGIEMELFKFCVYNMAYEEWREMFQPVFCVILDKMSAAKKFSKCWLPVILKKFPNFALATYSEISNIKSNDIRSKIHVSLLKTCRAQNIQLPCMQNEEEFLQHITELFPVAEEMRGDLFSLLCNFKDQSILYSKPELDIIFSFLRCNVNTNCTMLRQSMISSFSKFVLRLVCSTVKVIKKNKTVPNTELEHISRFLNEFHVFLINGIEPGSSYQRKVTSLNLYKIFMTYTVRNCGREIHRNNLTDVDKFVKFAVDEDSWQFTNEVTRKMLFRCLMDCCEEIQNLCFILLKAYFDINGIDYAIYADILEILKSNQYYKRSSGVYSAMTFVSLIYKTENSPCQLLQIGHANFTELFLCMLEEKISVIKKDILKCAVYYPLDADIKVLMYLMTNPESPEYNLTTEEHVERLISALEQIVPVLLKALFIDKSSDYAPSFEESDRALQTLIQESSISKISSKNGVAERTLHLQPLYQLLLNFIWITLKVTGEMESSLIVNRYTLIKEMHIVRIGNLIVSKLKLCRHKGVIEAAGISLSQVVNSLTERRQCEDWLESVLTEILQLIEFKAGASISRKSAGLSLLIHNIVGADKRPNKPFITKCWMEFQRILNINYKEIGGTITEELPQTHALHFLMTIVKDARNTAKLYIYLEEMLSLCIDMLKAPAWAIRNSSLQLFGELLPKLVGQRNSNANFHVKRTFEEIFYTMPNILNKILKMFEQSMLIGYLNSHANLAPLLVILDNLHVCNPNMLRNSLRIKLSSLQGLTERLLASPVYTIRELAGKALIGLYCKAEMHSKLADIHKYINQHLTPDRTKLKSENHFHGILLLLKQTISSFPEMRQELPIRYISPRDCYNVPLITQSLLYEMEFVQLNNDYEKTFNELVCVLNEVEKNRYRYVGYYCWVRSILRVSFTYYRIEDILRFSLNASGCILVACLEEIIHIQENNVSEEVFQILLDNVYKYINIPEVSTDVLNRIFRTFQYLYKSQKIHINGDLLENTFDLILNLNCHQYQGFNVRFLSIVVANSSKRINHLLRLIHDMLDITSCSKCIRLNSAYSLLEISGLLVKKEADMKLVWIIIVQMMQDEEIKVRLIGSKCFRKIFNSESNIAPEETLTSVFNSKLLISYLLYEDGIDVLWKKLEISDFEIIIPDNVTSPFDQGLTNSYNEEVKIVFLAGEEIINILYCNYEECSKYIVNKYKMYFKEHISDILSVKKPSELFLFETAYTLCIKSFYLLRIFKIVFSNNIHEFEVNSLSEINDRCQYLRDIFVRELKIS